MDQVPAELPAGDAMNIGVLLVSCKDSGRVTTLSRDWIHLAVGHAAGYFLRMSGGRQKIAFRVYEWHQLDMTSDGWNAAGLQVGDTVIPAVAKGHADLSHHDHFAIVIDKFDAKLGVRVPGRNHVLLGAQTLDPAIIQHEFGHLFGAGHANLDTPTGVVAYGDNFCVMGGEGGKYSFVHTPLNIGNAAGTLTTAFSDSGPGMVAPSLIACRWLDPVTHGVDVGPALRTEPFETIVELAALHGAPLSDGPGRPVIAWTDGVLDERLFIEFRTRRGDDQAIPLPGSGAQGWILLHTVQPPDSVHMGEMAAIAGESIYLSRGRLRVTVVAPDPGRETVVLRISRETWRPWFVPQGEQTFHRTAGVAAVARVPQHLDVFKVGRDHSVWSTWWHGDGDPEGWRPWAQLPSGPSFGQDAPVTALVRASDHIDLFATARDNCVWSCWWHADGTGWRPWFQIHPETVFPQDRPTVALARRPEHIDLFRVGFDGAVWSAWWHGEGDPGGWRPWFQIHPETRFSPRAEITAVAREAEHLDLFLVGLDGRVWTAWWHGAEDPSGWRSWATIGSGVLFDPTQRVAVIARAPGHLDLFCVDVEGIVWSTWWHDDADGWRSWFPIHDRRFRPDARVAAVAREPEHLDLFVTDDDGVLWTAWWHGGGDPVGWRPWSALQPGTASFDARVPVTAVARTPNHLDLFNVGNDGRIWSTFFTAV